LEDALLGREAEQRANRMCLANPSAADLSEGKNWKFQILNLKFKIGAGAAQTRGRATREPDVFGKPFCGRSERREELEISNLEFET